MVTKKSEGKTKSATLRVEGEVPVHKVLQLLSQERGFELCMTVSHPEMTTVAASSATGPAWRFR